MQRYFSIPFITLALALVPMFGCATADSQPVSAQDYSQPRETIRAAQQVGADEVPRARMFLNYAQDQVQKADKALQQDDHSQARLYLARAQADAELALTLAQERQMVEQVRQVDDRIQRLRQEVDE